MSDENTIKHKAVVYLFHCADNYETRLHASHLLRVILLFVYAVSRICRDQRKVGEPEDYLTTQLLQYVFKEVTSRNMIQPIHNNLI